MAFTKVHGMTIAQNGYIQNLVAETLTADPSAPQNGRVWYDSALNKFRGKFTDTIRSFATTDELNAAQSGLTVKVPVRATTTANITLSGEQTIDGVAVVAGNRVLVKDQTLAKDNGIYVVAAGAWARAADLDASDEMVSGVFTFVEEGTVYDNWGFVLATNNVITLGTTAIQFVPFTSPGAQRTFKYDGTTPALTHTLAHGLGTQMVSVQVWVKDNDDRYKADLVSVDITDDNNIAVSLTESRAVRAIVFDPS